MSTRSKTFPAWAVFSLAVNGLLALAIAYVLVRKYHWSLPSPVSQSAAATRLSYAIVTSTPDPEPEPGNRLQLTYKQWIELLQQEAAVAAAQKPEHLAILLGDSLSLWFPYQLLPPEHTWLNQGISGENTAGLLNRLALFDKTQPEVIFVMIGINDLIGGVKDETILANQRLIIRYLRKVHPKTKIVVQSILPHSAEKLTWERRDRLLSIPNSRIQELNQKLKAIAQREGVIYLNLYPLFTDSKGNLKRELSTDGLHLNPQGYLVWRNALIVFNQLVLKPTALK
ncbi:MAG TPA: lysophospholipase [Cyanobacteria bacterium UBA8553]|nr:lysophospholipase [Cyanobacteria bacterium UBA8553]HAJ60091.1 lysophospholipase [Cyanobacteria bacterium UBA8543]